MIIGAQRVLFFLNELGQSLEEMSFSKLSESEIVQLLFEVIRMFAFFIFVWLDLEMPYFY